MKLLITVIVCFFAGAGAGLGTGFAGLSAAAVISPMLIVFLNVPAYEAVAIALASDVLASAVSANTYRRSGNLDIKHGSVMLVSVLAFTVLGSYLASLVPEGIAGGSSVFMTLLLGIKFIVKPVMTPKGKNESKSERRRMIESLICGAGIGLICGYVGAGGGMMMLLILTSLLGYDLKTAVGTSVFIMSFTALTGSVSHILLGGVPDLLMLALCVVFTLVWAQIGASWANKAEPKKLNRATGIILTALGAAMAAIKLFT